MAREEQYDDFFTIDQDQLVEKWATFARDFFHKARDLADARAEMERTKRMRDVTRAELYKKICADPGEFGLAKTTESSIEMAIIRHHDYREADDAYLKAKHSMDIHQAFVDAMDVMKKGLEANTYLYNITYHGEPRARGDVRGAIADAKIDKAFRRASD